jgi:prepilin-type N-terminal cleavage/methylation domain-containing protein
MRRGFTLIEMIAAISISAVLTGIAMSLLVVLLQVERTGRAHVEENRTIYDLSDQFRRDVRAAERAVTNQGKKSSDILELSQGSTHIVHYEPAAGGVERLETVDGKTIRRESYALPSDWSAAIDVPSKTQPERVCITLAPKDASLRVTREVRVEAMLGQDHRFERGEEKK